MAKITVRNASTAEDDVTFIVAAFDSTLAPLAALGSGAMWGSTLFSQKDGFVEETVKDVRTSERSYEKRKAEAQYHPDLVAYAGCTGTQPKVDVIRGEDYRMRKQPA
ncbi:hypothetical protein K4K60_008692 [Colletotrichum sp. SAR11_57]|nr:hypothetical protein K4K60_008692 [Colletotrichum sp. SAR11_57]